jgi:hypothetical protein
LEKADIVEKQMLEGTNKNTEAPASTFTEEVQKNLEKHVDSTTRGQRPELPAKSRSMSGTSVTSDVSSIEEGGIGVYTSIDNGRRIRYKRTLRLKSDQLKDLQLQYGSNNARFSISTKIQVILNLLKSFQLFYRVPLGALVISTCCAGANASSYRTLTEQSQNLTCSATSFQPLAAFGLTQTLWICTDESKTMAIELST